jgi:hypothetical protein
MFPSIEADYGAECVGWATMNLPRGRTYNVVMSEFLSWQATWRSVIEAVERDVAEFNRNVDAFATSRLGRVLTSPDDIVLGVQVVAKNGPTETVVVQIDPNTRVIQFDGTISKPGVPRRDFFAINQDGRITLKEHVVGQPQPSNEPMTPEQFSNLVLVTLFGNRRRIA